MHFTHIYNIRTTTNSIKTIKQNDDIQQDLTNLTIWLRNIGGSIENKLKPGSPFTTDINLKNPAVVAIQEHMKNKLGTDAFRRVMKIQGYTLVAHTKAEWTGQKNRIKGGKKVEEGFSYTSDNNPEWMSIEILQEWIEKNRDNIGYI